LEVLVREVQISLHRVRAAIEGSEVNVETAIGFAGILPPEGMIIELGWGRLRRANDQDFAHLPSGLAGKLSHTAEDGTSTNIDYAGDLVLETSIPYKIRVTADDADEWPPSEWATIERRVEVLTLGGLLAFERWPRVALVPTWRIVFDPLAHGPLLSWSDPRGGPGLTPYALDEGQMALLTDWVRRVHDGRRRSIEVSIRRFISAVTQRKDPVDGLVDAAIVWENLFGTRQGEATLRISASLAWLLEDTPAKREARYGQIAKLYGVRSDVVHGNRFVPSEEAAEANRIAIEATAAALRVLFSARQDLLGLDGGGARSRQLLLGREAPLSSDNPS